MTASRSARALTLMNGGWFSLTREFLVGEGGDEPVLVPIPMAYTYATIARTLLSGNVWDRAETTVSLARLRALGEAGATMIPGHEPLLWTRFGEPPVRLS